MTGKTTGVAGDGTVLYRGRRFRCRVMDSFRDKVEQRLLACADLEEALSGEEPEGFRPLGAVLSHPWVDDPGTVLHLDFAPLSFTFGARSGIMGGIIFHGPHDRGGDGGAPTFSVCLEGVNGWSLHS